MRNSFISSKKGNSIVLLLVVIMGLVTAGMYTTNYTPSLDDTQSDQETLATEVSLALSKGITLGITDFLLDGFSDENKVWYCNYPYSPDVEEVNRSLHTAINTRVEGYLETIRTEEALITTPDYSFDVFSLEEDELNETALTVFFDELYVGKNTSLHQEYQELSNSYTYPWKVWLMYKGMKNWNNANAGALTDEIYTKVFEEKPCQAISSNCFCAAGTMISNQTKEDMKVTLEDVYPALDASLEKLNNEFEGTGISCTYSIKRYSIKNIENIDYYYSLSSHLDSETQVLDWDKTKYEYDMHHFVDEFTLPNPGADTLGGCPTSIKQTGSDNATYRPQQVDFETGVKETTYEEPVNETCTDYEEISFMKNELFSIDKQLGLLLTFRCEDEDVVIEQEEGLLALAAEVEIRVSLRLDCPLPDQEEISTQKTEGGEEPYVCGGGGGGGIITEGPIGCVFDNECGECEICVEDESDERGYTCLPKPELVPCSGVCAVCDGAGECSMPAPRGVPDECSGNCMVCDGENMGADACILGVDGLAEQFNLACDGTCMLCDENAQCNKIPEDFETLDSSHCEACQTCGLTSGGQAECVANPEDDGEFVKGMECRICEGGEIVEAISGEKDPEDCGKCEGCHEGACGFHPEKSPTLNECGKCKTCGEVDGEASCVADADKDGNTCGNRGCSLCNAGECGPSPETVGQVCRTNHGCETVCSADGKCNDGSSTAGDSCTKQSSYACVQTAVCSEGGSCIVDNIPSGKQCCGDLICNAGDPCCENGGGVGIWTCEACDDATT